VAAAAPSIGGRGRANARPGLEGWGHGLEAVGSGLKAVGSGAALGAGGLGLREAGLWGGSAAFPTSLLPRPFSSVLDPLRAYARTHPPTETGASRDAKAPTPPNGIVARAMDSRTLRRRAAACVAALALAGSSGCPAKRDTRSLGACKKLYEQCSLRGGALGVCNSAACPEGQAPPCFQCVSQH